MEPNEMFDASVMLTFLKREETLYKEKLQQMEQEYMRLQIEEFALKAAIRQEQMKHDELCEKQKTSKLKISALPGSSNIEVKTERYNKFLQDLKTNSQHMQNAYGNTQENSEVHTPQVNSVCSNITDDRYLEPLILNPNLYNDGGLVEFDD